MYWHLRFTYAYNLEEDDILPISRIALGYLIFGSPFMRIFRIPHVYPRITSSPSGADQILLRPLVVGTLLCGWEEMFDTHLGGQYYCIGQTLASRGQAEWASVSIPAQS